MKQLTAVFIANDNKGLRQLRIPVPQAPDFEFCCHIGEVVHARVAKSLELRLSQDEKGLVSRRRHLFIYCDAHLIFLCLTRQLKCAFQEV